MIVVVRDDDTCGFTRPEEIQACYGSVWSDMPVSLSVTPFRIPGNDRNLPENLAGNMDTLPLHKAPGLVDFLKDGIRQGRMNIAMHGYHHLRYRGLPEYVGGSDLERKTIEGKEYLEKVLDTTVCAFVPPNNAISLTGVNAVVRAGMSLVHIPSLWGRAFRSGQLRVLLKAPGFYWHRKLRNRQYPYVIECGDHKEIGYHTVGPRSIRKRLFQELEYCREKNGVFVLATHYHAFDRKTENGETVRHLLFDLLETAQGFPGVSFQGINSIW